MEKGKSQKQSPVIEDNKKKDKNEEEPPARQPISYGRPPSSTRPGSSVNRPGPISQTSVPSVAPTEEDLPDSVSEAPSQQPSQIPTFAVETSYVLPSSHPSASSTADKLPSSPPSDAPSIKEETPSTAPSELPTNELSSNKPSQVPSSESSVFIGKSSIEKQTNATSTKEGTKISILGDMTSAQNRKSNVSVGNNGKVSFSGSKEEEEDGVSGVTKKVTMSGVLSNKKYDDVDVSISKRGKVSFSGNKEETPSPAPVASKRSNKVSMTGILSSSNKNKKPVGLNGNVPFSNSNAEDLASEPSYMPTYLPTLSYLDYNKHPSSSEGGGKLSLSFPTSREQNKQSNPVPKNSHEFKPISFYTDTPTSYATSHEPSLFSQKSKREHKKTPSSKVSESEEPAYFMYPTYYPTVDLTSKNNRNYESTSYPTYWPSYMPTEGAKHLFAMPVFDDASGRGGNFGILDFQTHNEDSVNETQSNQTATLDFVSSDAAVNSDQVESNEYQSKEDGESIATSGEETEYPIDVYQKKICPGFPLGVDPSSPKVEQEVLFTYGIEVDPSDSSIAAAVNTLQTKILDDTATIMLRCNGHSLWWGNREQPVSRVYYRRDANISSLSKCASSSESKQCAIVESAIYLTVEEGGENHARAEALYVINHKLERGDYQTESVEYTHYLGPDVEQLAEYLQRKSSSGNAVLSAESSSASPHLFYGAVTMASIAIFALLVFGVVYVRNRRKKKAAKHFEILANSMVPSRSNDPYSPYSQSVHYSASPQTNVRAQYASELGDWRSLVGRERF